VRGRCLLSLPFAVEAGVCSTDDTARRALERAAADLCRQRGAAFLELRDGLDADGFQQRQGTYYRFRRALRSTDDDNFAAIPRKQRRMIRVGQRHGLVVDRAASDVRAFHDLYARSVRRLGTPVFSPDYFRLLLETFPGRAEILTVSSAGRPVAGVLSFFFGDTVMPYYAGSRPDSRRLAANDVMYWELMRDARRRGLRRFDFGRSKRATGAFDYKRHWGFDAEPLRYRVLSPSGHPVAQRTIDDGPLRLLRWAWSRLPLEVTKILGPPLVRRFGPLYT
jgi:FemAB-related protein (PEP-CTERM system-associated)